MRELRNAVERAMLLAEAPVSSCRTSRWSARPALPRAHSTCRLRASTSKSLERSLVVQALERCGGNQTRAATLLGMNRDQIRYRIEKYGLVRAVAH